MLFRSDVCKKFVSKVEEGCVGPSDKKRKSLLPMLPLLNPAHRAMSKEQLTLPDARHNKSVSPSFRDRSEMDNSSCSALAGTEDVLDAGDLTKVVDNHCSLMSPNNNQPDSLTSSPKGVRRSVSARTGGAETPRSNNRRGAIPRKLSDPMSLAGRRARPMSLDADSVSGTDQFQLEHTIDCLDRIRTQHCNNDQSEHSMTSHMTVLTNQNTALHVTGKY